MSNQIGTEESAPLTQQANPLRTALVRSQDFWEANGHIFTSLESWKWFVHQHKHELVECGALHYLCGKQLIRPDKMSEALERIGRRLAESRAA